MTKGMDFRAVQYHLGYVQLFGLPSMFRPIPIAREGTTNISAIVVWTTPSAPVTARISAVTFLKLT